MRQLGWALTARALPDPIAREVQAVLSPAEWALFQRFDAHGRRHACRVLAQLRAAGQDRPELLAAALLHDIGKTCLPLRIRDRGWIVIGMLIFPRAARRWGQQPPPYGWRRPFVIKERHPEWGADLARAAGSAPLTVNLIRRHQDPPTPSADPEEDALLAWLQWADDRS